MTAQERISPPLSPERARDLVLALERRGLDTSRIHVETATPVTAAATSKVDREVVGRPGRRVGLGLAVGLVIGVLVGLVASAIFDAQTAATVLAIGIGGSVLGGLVGLYSRLPMSAEISDADADAAGLSAVRVDIAGLTDDEIDAIDEQLLDR